MIKVFLGIFLNCFKNLEYDKKIQEFDEQIPYENSLYALSISGTLYKISLLDGSIVWKHQDDELLSVNASLEDNPYYKTLLVPDPTDGTLFTFHSNDDDNFKLNKLCNNIQQMVGLSPVRASNGVIQLGSKKDYWVEIDSQTGFDIMNVTNHSRKKASDSLAFHSILLLTKTRYSLSFYQKNLQHNIFNITMNFYHFKTQSFLSDHIFLTSPSGILISVEKISSKIVWRVSLNSVTVHVFRHVHSNSFKLPLYHVSDEFLRDLYPGSFFDQSAELSTISTNTVTRHKNCIYTVQSYEPIHITEIVSLSHDKLKKTTDLILLKNKPKKDSVTLYPISEYIAYYNFNNQNHPNLIYFTNGIYSTTAESAVTVNFGTIILSFSLILTTLVSSYWIAIFKGYSKPSLIVAEADPKDPYLYRIGKITFNTSKILGKGSDGTVIYGGWFEDREVAVKRVLQESTDVVKQEVQILKESDQHSNVIRYFCTERDFQFHYIAVELCQFNLQEFVLNSKKFLLTEKEVLHQAASGLQYLHNMRIIHRDIKPHNVLISQPDSNGRARVILSDFGLCRKLAVDKSVLSSSITTLAGTCGWVAPEIFEGKNRFSFASDIFSLGCVFYFVLSGGLHPFGDLLHRQCNIQTHQCLIDTFIKNINKEEAQHIIYKMIDHEPSARCNISDVLSHLFFFNEKCRSSFLHDFSNYIDDLNNFHPIIRTLESNALEIVRGSWSFHIPPFILFGLLSHRSYSSTSVRDLLRAIRNKTNHFKESSKELKDFFENDPENILKFISSKFPAFMIHVYETAKYHDFQNIPNFKQYFIK